MHVCHDGAMAAGCLTDATEVGGTFLAGVEGLLTFRTGDSARRRP